MLLFLLDKWLTKMSEQGFYLVDYSALTYVFEIGEPLSKEYFSYTCDRTGEGKYSILLRYPGLKKVYGISRKKSKLNANEKAKGNTIIEIDTKRIDIENDMGYKELKKDRNRLYFLITLRDVGVFFMMVVMVALIAFLKP